MLFQYKTVFTDSHTLSRIYVNAYVLSRVSVHVFVLSRGYVHVYVLSRVYVHVYVYHTEISEYCAREPIYGIVNYLPCSFEISMATKIKKNI